MEKRIGREIARVTGREGGQVKPKTPSLDLMEYIERNILPRYAHFDRAHSMEHVTRVIRSSLELAALTGADVDMVYTIAAYHDIGMEGPRAIHHITGGRIIAADKQLRRWFSEEQIRIMREAVEDHRASASRAPRSIYGKIVAEADRDLEPIHVIKRAVEYGVDHYPQLDKEGQWERFRSHVRGKYGVGGYMRLWIPGSRNARYLRQLQEIIADEGQLRQAFERLYDEESR